MSRDSQGTSLRSYRGHAQPAPATRPPSDEPLPIDNTQAARVTRRAAFRRSFVLSAAAEAYLDRHRGLSNQS